MAPGEHPPGANLGARRVSILYIAKKGVPSVAPRRVKICPPGAKLGSRRVIFFLQILKVGAKFGSQEGENLPSWRQTWLQEGDFFS